MGYYYTEDKIKYKYSMKKIKNIYTFGTSFTNGGGFEFDTESKNQLKKYYDVLEIPLKKENFKWTYLLSNLLNQKINITNLSKDGFGNERMYRKIFELSSEENFLPSENLFVLELSDLGRKEVFSPKDKKYGIINYDIESLKLYGNSFNYFQDQYQFHLDDITNAWDVFNKKQFDFQSEMIKLYNSLMGVISYLEFMKIPYIILEGSIIRHSPHNTHFYDKIQEKVITVEGEGLFAWLTQHDYTIKGELQNIWPDGHWGYTGNIVMADLVFNKMIDLNYSNEKKIPFDETISKTNSVLEILEKNIKQYL
tara:strand:+ start:2471 stop:3397 length:927 start_codon:yes stop_codon:yes gene_type:complete